MLLHRNYSRRSWYNIFTRHVWFLLGTLSKFDLFHRISVFIYFACLNSSATVGDHGGTIFFGSCDDRRLSSMVDNRPRFPVFIVLIRRNNNNNNNNKLWKILTSIITLIIANELYNYLAEKGLIPWEQKRCKRKSRRTKDHLLVDKTIMRHARRKHRHLSMVWIDYKKAYDSIPYSWLLKSLDLI